MESGEVSDEIKEVNDEITETSFKNESIPSVFKTMNPFSRRIYFGMTRSGKSYRVKKNEISSLLKIIPGKLIIYDPKLEYAGPHAVDVEYPQGTVVATVDTLNGFKQAIAKYNAKVVVIQPDAAKMEGDEIEFFDSICKFIYNYRNHFRGSVLIVDEAESIAPVSKIPKYFNAIIKQMAAYDIGVVAVTQRPAELHGSIKSQAEYIFFFFIHSPRDIIALGDMIGRDWAEKMRNDREFAKNHKFIALHQSGEKIVGGG